MDAPKTAPKDRAPEWETTRWFNTDSPITLESLRGKVVALEVFQLLCPGCVSQGLPQAQRIASTFDHSDVQVLGLHSVFEHHSAMDERVLNAFMHEYRIDFPVGVDAPSDADDRPRTMTNYRLRGTPTLLLFDRMGRLRHHHFGHEPDMSVGAEIATLVLEPSDARCDDGVCQT